MDKISENVELINLLSDEYIISFAKVINRILYRLTDDEIESIPLIGVSKVQKETLENYGIVWSMPFKEDYVSIYSCGGKPFRIKVIEP